MKATIERGKVTVTDSGGNTVFQWFSHSLTRDEDQRGLALFVLEQLIDDPRSLELLVEHFQKEKEE